MRTKYLLAFSTVMAALFLPCTAQAQDCSDCYGESFGVYDSGSNTISGYSRYTESYGDWYLSVESYLSDPSGTYNHLGGSSGYGEVEVDFSYTPAQSGSYSIWGFNYIEIETWWEYDTTSEFDVWVPATAEPVITSCQVPSWVVGSNFFSCSGSGFTSTSPSLWWSGNRFGNADNPFLGSNTVTVVSDSQIDVNVELNPLIYSVGWIYVLDEIADYPMEVPMMAPPPTVQISSADITNDNITIVLSGSLSPLGQLSIAATGQNGQPVDTPSVSGNPYGPGTYNFQFFFLGTIPTGEYTTITATWAVNGVNIVGTLGYHFKVLGPFIQTQYNTPRESDSSCAGSSTSVTVFNASCNPASGSPDLMLAPFVSAVNVQGSGHSTNHGDIQLEALCANRGSNSFRGNVSIVPSLGGEMNNSTVAVCSSYRELYLPGTRLFIKGEGVKTVTDACSKCCLDAGYAHLDNYTTSQACSGIVSLPTAITILLY